MTDSDWKKEASRIADGIRRRVLEHTVRNDGGYVSQACSSAEIFATLYARVMNLGVPDAPIFPRLYAGTPGPDNSVYRTGVDFNGGVRDDLDRFILSPTHYSMVLYAALIETGRMTSDGLDMFNRDGSSVEMIGAEHSPGMEVMTGSLGQGLAQAVGMALGRRLKGATGRVVVMMSDGEFQIGMTWESIQFASHYTLDNLMVVVDANGQQCDGVVESVMGIEPLDRRIDSFGGRVVVVNGHDVDEISTAASLPPDGRPLFVLARTDPCRGMDLLRSRAPKLHYLRFKCECEKRAWAGLLDAWPVEVE